MRKGRVGDPASLVLLEIQACFHEHVNTGRIVSVYLLVELQIELPGGNGLWGASFLVCEGDSDLDELHFVDIVPNPVVMRSVLELAVSPLPAFVDDAWKFCVLNKRKMVNKKGGYYLQMTRPCTLLFR